jgi:hypothetical protein
MLRLSPQQLKKLAAVLEQYKKFLPTGESRKAVHYTQLHFPTRLQQQQLNYNPQLLRGLQYGKRDRYVKVHSPNELQPKQLTYKPLQQANLNVISKNYRNLIPKTVVGGQKLENIPPLWYIKEWLSPAEQARKSIENLQKRSRLQTQQNMIEAQKRQRLQTQQNMIEAQKCHRSIMQPQPPFGGTPSPWF